MKDFLKAAGEVKPTPQQLAWFDMEMYAFIHFGPNTFTGKDWGDGSEDEAIFAPARLDCDQWVAAVKEAGMKGLILTAKHHDGFCLWPSAYTEHSVKNSPYKIDVVKEAADACKRGGIKFGIYLSPWDRNSKYYGTSEYNDYFCNQLTELLTGYGELFYLWFDNACGEGPNGKRQVYDFPRYFELIRKYQPNAVIFNDFGPDVRWCGNEAGSARHAEWAVVPSELCHYSPIQTGPGPMANDGGLDFLYNRDQSLGTLSNILYSKGLVFTPAEIDTSIRPQWFWHPWEKAHSLEHLFRIYLNSVGANTCLNLNIPPNQDGLLDENDVTRLKEFGALIKKEFGQEIPCTIVKEEAQPSTQPLYTVTLDRPVKEIKYVVLQEDLSKGQRVESFRILGGTGGLTRFPLYQGTSIGHKKICQLQDPFAEQNPLISNWDSSVNTLQIHVTASRGKVELKHIKVF